MFKCSSHCLYGPSAAPWVYVMCWPLPTIANHILPFPDYYNSKVHSIFQQMQGCRCTFTWHLRSLLRHSPFISFTQQLNAFLLSVFSAAFPLFSPQVIVEQTIQPIINRHPDTVYTPPISRTPSQIARFSAVMYALDWAYDTHHAYLLLSLDLSRF